MLTFGNVKSSGVLNISNVTASSDAFRQLVNTATERLLRRGDWDGTIVPIHICIYNGCIVWPRYVKEVRAMNLCNSPVPIMNDWYDFLPYQSRKWTYDGNWWNNLTVMWHGYMGSASRMITKARTSVFQDVLGDARYIRAYPSTPLDNNKKVWIFGEDNNGQPLMTQGVGGWTNGIDLSLVPPYVQSTQYVRRIDYVLKQATQGPVRLYAYNTSSSVLEPLANYDASETEPSYLKTSLQGACFGNSCQNTNSQTRTVIALVKLQFVPVKNDNDLVLIENLEALKMMMISVKCEDAFDRAGKVGAEQDAIRALNLDLWQRDQESQVPVDLGDLGNTYVGRQRVF